MFCIQTAMMLYVCMQCNFFCISLHTELWLILQFLHIFNHKATVCAKHCTTAEFKIAYWVLYAIPNSVYVNIPVQLAKNETQLSVMTTAKTFHLLKTEALYIKRTLLFCCHASNGISLRKCKSNWFCSSLYMLKISSEYRYLDLYHSFVDLFAVLISVLKDTVCCVFALIY